MITPELIARINALAKKKRSEGLEPHELLEQKKLYRIYRGLYPALRNSMHELGRLAEQGA